MLKFKDVPQEQQGEVIRIASEMYDRETTQTREHNSTVAAAEELGIPEEYLERAAQELQGRRIAEARLKRERRNKWLIGGGIALAALTIPAFILRPVATVPSVMLNPDFAQPILSANAGTQATVTTQGNQFVLKVDKFADQNGKYSANLDLPLANTSLAQHRQLTFTIQSQGTIPKVRLFAEGGSVNERWKGPDVSLSDKPRQVTVPLDQFIRQERASSSANWKDISKSRPGNATTLSIKSGAPFNPSNVSGTIGISDIEIK